MSAADARLKSLIDRILRCREAEDEAKEDTKAVYAEAKGEGYDKTAMGQLVTYLRKKEKNGEKLAEQSAIFDLYLTAYERPSHAHTREGTEFGSSAKTRNSHHVGHGPENPGAVGAVAALAPNPQTPDPHLSAAADGQPGIPSSEAAGAKSDGLATVVDQGGDQPEHADRHSEQAVDHFEPPAFLARQKTMADYRPHCMHPDNCGSYSLDYCYGCRKALEAAEHEVAA